jgi:hypothetical protein
LPPLLDASIIDSSRAIQIKNIINNYEDMPINNKSDNYDNYDLNNINVNTNALIPNIEISNLYKSIIIDILSYLILYLITNNTIDVVLESLSLLLNKILNEASLATPKENSNVNDNTLYIDKFNIIIKYILDMFSESHIISDNYMHKISNILHLLFQFMHRSNVCTLDNKSHNISYEIIIRNNSKNYKRIIDSFNKLGWTLLNEQNTSPMVNNVQYLQFKFAKNILKQISYIKSKSSSIGHHQNEYQNVGKDTIQPMNDTYNICWHCLYSCNEGICATKQQQQQQQQQNVDNIELDMFTLGFTDDEKEQLIIANEASSRRKFEDSTKILDQTKKRKRKYK